MAGHDRGGSCQLSPCCRYNTNITTSSREHLSYVELEEGAVAAACKGKFIRGYCTNFRKSAQGSPKVSLLIARLSGLPVRVYHKLSFKQSRSSSRSQMAPKTTPVQKTKLEDLTDTTPVKKKSRTGHLDKPTVEVEVGCLYCLP